MGYIDTESYSARLRKRAVLPSDEKLLIARLSGSEQEKDLSLPTNCRGYGRVRHFQFYKHTDWSPDPLPIVPASKALQRPIGDLIRAQVFQLAACNWRCWYCFVDYSRLSADYRVADFFSADELVDMYLDQSDPPEVIDLTGGQPDLVPEWTVWMMKALEERGLQHKVFVWADDNLSNRYYWDFLTQDQRSIICSYPLYSRVACFKGYNDASFSFNTLADPALFDQQFEIYGDLLREGFDMYAYVTLTAVQDEHLHSNMIRFVDKLQAIHENLPLRTVPLKIEAFTPTKGRLKAQHERAIVFQHEVHAAWLEQLRTRFPAQMLVLPICDVPMRL